MKLGWDVTCMKLHQCCSDGSNPLQHLILSQELTILKSPKATILRYFACSMIIWTFIYQDLFSNHDPGVNNDPNKGSLDLYKTEIGKTKSSNFLSSI